MSKTTIFAGIGAFVLAGAFMAPGIITSITESAKRSREVAQFRDACAPLVTERFNDLLEEGKDANDEFIRYGTAIMADGRVSYSDGSLIDLVILSRDERIKINAELDDILYGDGGFYSACERPLYTYDEDGDLDLDEGVDKELRDTVEGLDETLDNYNEYFSSNTAADYLLGQIQAAANR